MADEADAIAVVHQDEVPADAAAAAAANQPPPNNVNAPPAAPPPNAERPDPADAVDTGERLAHIQHLADTNPNLQGPNLMPNQLLMADQLRAAGQLPADSNRALPMPTFHGQEPTHLDGVAWIEASERYLVLPHAATSITITGHCSMALKGDAAKWFTATRILYHDLTLDWKHFKYYFFSRWCTHKENIPRATRRHQQKGLIMGTNEPWKVFWDRCVTVVDHCRYDEPPPPNETREQQTLREQHNRNTLQKVLIDKFLDGVNPTIANALIDKDYTTAQELYELTAHTVAVLIDKGLYTSPLVKKEGIGAAISAVDYALHPTPAPAAKSSNDTSKAIMELVKELKASRLPPPPKPAVAAASSATPNQSAGKKRATSGRRPRGDPNKFCEYHKRSGHSTSECRAKAASSATVPATAAVTYTAQNDFFTQDF